MISPMSPRTTPTRGTLLVAGAAMIIVTIAAFAVSQLRDDGPRPFDPEQHLRLVSSVPGNGIGPPDLMSIAPQPVAVDTITFAETELLVVRFNSRITNIGPGPLDVFGNPRSSETDPDDGPHQRIWDGESWNRVDSSPIKFESADGHNHFHLMQIARYSLWDETRSHEIAPSSKVGFCLTDSTGDDPEAQRGYFGDDGNYCRQGSPEATILRMGISPGFSDIYTSDVALQWVDVSDVVPGRYYVAGEVDPFGVVFEADESNNSIVYAESATIVSGLIAQPWVSATDSRSSISVELRPDAVGTPAARQVRILSGPTHGTLSPLVARGQPEVSFFTYTPDPGFVGVDSFTYLAFDPTTPYPLTPVESVGFVTVGEVDQPAIAIHGRRSTIHTASTLALAVVTSSDGTPLLEPTWSVEGIVGGSPTVGTIDPDGLYHAPAIPLGPVEITASVDGSTASTRIEVVTPPNHRPFIQPPLAYLPLAAAADPQEKVAVTNLPVGEPAGFLVPATDPNGDTIEFSADNLPPGLTIDPSTGFVSGTPTERGEFTVTFIADDATTTSSLEAVLTVG